MRRLIALAVVFACSCASQHRYTVISEPAPNSAHLSAEALWRYPVATGAIAGIGPGMTWTFRGPQNLSGITYCLLLDPSDPNVFLSGSAEGLWRSDDAGANWYAVSTFDGLQVMALARDPRNGDVLYAATGFEGIGADGLYKSEDRGNSWRKLSLPVSATTRSVAVSPDDSSVVVAGTSSGVFRSADAGESWNRVISAGVNAMVAFTPNDGSRVIVGLRDEGESGGAAHVLLSTDGGLTFHEASGVKASDAYSVVVAVAPSMPQRVYAATVGRSVSNAVLWRSDDGGESFRNVAAFPEIFGYHIRNSLFVLPTNADTVMYAGIDARISTAGGSEFARLPTTGQGDVVWPHYDYLSVVASDKRIYVCTDGGVYATEDLRSGNWVPLARGHASTQYYSIDVSARGRIAGGMQDTGVSLIEPGTLDAQHLHDADTTTVLFDPKNDSSCFAGEFGKITTCDGGMLFDVADRALLWGNPMAISPADPTRLYAASLRVVRLDQIQDRNNIIVTTTIRASDGKTHFGALTADPLDADVVWIASDEGTIYKTANARSTTPAWTTMFTSTAELSARRATTIFIDPHDSQRICVGAEQGILQSSDGGSRWRAVFGPIPVQRIAEHPQEHGWLYAGTHAGLFLSEDGGEHWSAAAGATVPVRLDVRDLVFQPGTETLYIATYGRGIWSADIPVDSRRRRAVAR